jgi:hypothetical protein
VAIDRSLEYKILNALLDIASALLNIQNAIAAEKIKDDKLYRESINQSGADINSLIKTTKEIMEILKENG